VQSSSLKAIGALVCLLILSGALVVGTGCGGSGDTIALQAERVAAEKPRPKPSKIALYMKHRFGNESWYPLITHIDESSGSSTVTVETKLTNHKTPHWNEKQAEVMCRAFITAPGVKTAGILWDARTTYEVFSC